MVIAVNDKVKGFRNSEENQIIVTPTIVDSKLIIEIVEPSGFLLFGSSSVTIYLSESALEEKTFVIDSGKGDIKFEFVTPFAFDVEARVESTQYITMRKLTADTDGGDIILEDAKIVSEISPFAPLDEIDEEDPEVISAQIGLVIGGSPKSVQADKLIIGNIYVELGTSSIVLENVTGNIDVRASNSSVRADIVTGNVRYEGRSGYVDIDVLVGNYTLYSTLNCDTIIGEVTGAVYVSGEEEGFGKVEIGSIGDTAIVTTNRGNIEVGSIYGEAVIETVYGDVDIANMYNNVDITTVYGEVSVIMATTIINEITSEEEDTLDYDIKVEGKNGDIYVENIKGFVNINVVTGGDAMVTAKFLKVAQSPEAGENAVINSIVAQSGSVNIEIKRDLDFTISLNSNVNAVLATILKTNASLSEETYKTIVAAQYIYNEGGEATASLCLLDIQTGNGVIIIEMVS